ncbi:MULTISPECIES: LysR substrate-binding domain-containing protein [Acinetobacter]|uniref:LysR substrate-binding domain-containing protein n=1 Tax=Acinetobacter TaxID=469 RepID=UPI00141B4455|nr:MULTISPECIES: LysR substrate-binding domain-containing protein [Acinetobacter]MCS4299107.1 DNA-binding transcriptional LysR family regulator [Acinetobacter guillouiae]MCW2250246.1 DNA-binding transcriptional LysR family regulator [Acinetobacter sp. BIGb0204]NII39349.1 DNA-binding transcriptional LysR family regulator [Acinetobacter sp. BIGb0196]
MTLEIRWIEDLLALEQEKSISQAAEVRHVTQSAFTRRIQNIENAFGFQILKRYSKNIDFTEAGQILLASSKNIQNQLNATINYLEKNIKNNELNIRFAVSHSLTTQFFPRFINDSLINLEDLKLEIIASNFKQGLGLLKDGSCDLLICYCDQKTLQQLDLSLFVFHKIVKMEILPVTALDNGIPKYSIDQPFPLLAYSKQAYLRNCVDEVIEKNLNYRTLYETDNASDLKELVIQGLGIAWLPKLLIEKEISENKLKIIDNKNYNTSQDVYIIRHKIVISNSINQIWRSITAPKK